MSRFKIRIRLKLYQLILLAIIIASIYLIIKFAAISFSDNIGQAGVSKKAFSFLSRSVMAKGNSLISYTAKSNTQSALIDNIMADKLALTNFINDDAISTFAHNSSISSIENSNPYPLLSDAYMTENIKATADSPMGLSYCDKLLKHPGLEYILTNGAVINSEASGRLIWDGDIAYEQLNIGYLSGEISPVPEDIYSDEAAHEATATVGRRIDYTMEQLKDMNFLIRNFYYVDGTTVADGKLFDGEKLASTDMTLKQDNEKPQILIFHTHSQEAFIDSRPGAEEDTVVGMGALLAKVLREDYHYNVIHDKTYYDVLKGYNKSYSQAEAGLKKILNENPTIEVIIDVHRNSGKEKIVYINGKETAQVMMFNGLCRDHDGPMTDLENPYLQDNLSFSLQLQLKSFDIYPGLFNKNYLKAYRYNMHFRPKSLLVELGSVNNTVDAAKNAIVLFAEVLDAVLKDDKEEAVAE